MPTYRTEFLPEGVWLTTCAELPGLVVETDTREEGGAAGDGSGGRSDR